jgi:K+-transporting ATPase ATPase C chain
MKSFITALRVFGLLSLLTGVLYPLLITGLTQFGWASQAHGSPVRNAEGQIVGSKLLAQEFKSPRYFWPRPSAGNFATVASGASNLGPTSDALRQAINDRAIALRQAHGLVADASVPEELLQTSGSGLDPHISPEAAEFQIKRVCEARNFTPAQSQQVTTLVHQLSEPPQLDFLGEARVNVLMLNMELDAIK